MPSETEDIDLEENSTDPDSEGYRPPPLWEDYLDSKGQIVCNEGTDYRINFYLAILFFAISYPVAKQLQFENVRDDLFVYAVRSIFPLIGIASLIYSFRAYTRMKKFGASTFHIKDKTGLLGGTLGGTIKTEVELLPKSDYTVSLECLRTTRNNEGKSRHAVLWKGSNKIPKSHYKSNVGIPVNFAVPSDLPQSSRYSGEGIQWYLRISAPTKGLNYKAAFLVPVVRSR